jgi:lycopene cyclase domain-containing protein
MRYLLVMGACVVITLPLELLLRARVYARWRRLVLTLLPVLAVFVTWDVLAIHAGFWSYRHLTGVRIGNLPIEELVFFLVIPTCAVLTFEAVRRLRPAWRVRDDAVEAER